jgi:hypothetical protein
MSSQGVYAANFWPLNGKPTYVAGAIRLYRNYDGQKGAYGSAAAQATASNRDAASVFASFNPGGDEIHVIAINKSPTETVNGTFTVASPVPLAGIKAYGFDASSAIPAAKTGAALGAGGFTCVLPPWSATHFVIKTDGALPAVALRAPALRTGSGPSAPAYLPDGRLFPPSPPGRAAALPRYLRP